MFTYIKNKIFILEFYSSLEYNSNMGNLNEKVDELKKKLILETASEYFKTLGYGKTQIDKISKDLNIGVGTIYGYFKSKEGLFIAWLQNIINNVYEQMKEGCDKVSDPIDKLAVVIDYKVSYFEKNKVTVKSYMENNQLFLRGISRRKEHPMAVILEFCADIIKEIKPMDDQEAYLLANIFDGIINTYIECSLEDESLFNKKDEILQRFLKVVGV